MRKAKEKALGCLQSGGVTPQKSQEKNENSEKTIGKTRSALKTQSKNVQDAKLPVNRAVKDTPPKNMPKTIAVKGKSSEKVDAKNREEIYNYSFDGDKTINEDKNSAQLQDFFKKLADEKKITLKKYKSKALKGKADKTERKKPRNNVQQVKSTQNKPNLIDVNKKELRVSFGKVEVDSNKNVVQRKSNSTDTEADNKTKERKDMDTNVKNIELLNRVLTRSGKNLELRHRPTQQSTPISTPLRKRQSSDLGDTSKSATVLSDVSSSIFNASTSSIVFESHSIEFDPVSTNLLDKENSVSLVRKSLRKSPRKSSSITETVVNKEKPVNITENIPRKAPSPVPGCSKDFEATFQEMERTQQKSMSTSTLNTSVNKGKTVTATQNRAPSPVAGCSKDYDASFSQTERTPQKSNNTSTTTNHCSIFPARLKERSIFPAKTYGSPKRHFDRSPLKNIQNDNSTFSVSNIDLLDTSTRSNTASNKSFKSSIDLVLQSDIEELPSLFDSEHPSDDIQKKFTVNNYFGFDDDEDHSFQNEDSLSKNGKSIEVVKAKPRGRPKSAEKMNDKLAKKSKNTPKKKSEENQEDLLDHKRLDKVRANLKQFLHNPVPVEKTSVKGKARKPVAQKLVVSNVVPHVESPNASTSKILSPPAQSTPKIFSDSRDNQKDIRSVLTAVNRSKDEQNDDMEKDKNRQPSPLLFEEIETVKKHDVRKSYARPTKQYKKRRISIDSDVESDREHDDDDGGTKKRKTKKKKLIDDLPGKEDQELEKFAKEFNSMCDDVDKYELIKVKE